MGINKDMHTVKAPKGWEGLRCYCDATRSWHVSIRRVGETWWTVVGDAGHAWFTSEVLDTRAEAVVAQAVSIRTNTHDKGKP